MSRSNNRYLSYGEFLQEKFDARIHKIPINAGFTCPNRDGSIAVGGCTYCNIASFTPESARARIPIKQQIESSINYLKGRFKAKAFIAYFQPYTNTYAPLAELKELYEQALGHPEIIGLSIGTRPDCIDEPKLEYLEQLAREYFLTIEYGIESVHDKTLDSINRGHDFNCTAAAIHKTAGRGIFICGHVIYGFPNETRVQMFETTEAVSELPLDFIKIHNLHIVRNTELGRQYLENPFHVFSFNEWVNFVCEILEKLNPDFMIERLYGDAPKDLLIEPQWCQEKSAAEIIYAIQQRLESLNTYQGRRFSKAVPEAGYPV